MSSAAAVAPPDLRLLAIGSALTLALLAILALGFGRDPRAVPAALESRPAPAFQLVDLDGQPQALERFAGRPVVLNFWSTWCQPCKLEHAALQAAQRRFPEVRFFGVIYSDDPDAARRSLKRAGSAYPNLIDPGGRVAIDYGVAGVPETYFIDRGGVVVRKYSGPLSEWQLSSFLQPLLEAR